MAGQVRSSQADGTLRSEATASTWLPEPLSQVLERVKVRISKVESPARREAEV